MKADIRIDHDLLAVEGEHTVYAMQQETNYFSFPVQRRMSIPRV